MLGVTVGEAVEQGLAAWDDSARPGVPEEHAYLDFRHLPSKGEQQRRAVLLLSAALARGWAHREPGQGDPAPTKGS